MASGVNILIVFIVIGGMVALIQLGLSLKESIVWGFMLPISFLFVAGYNLYKSLFVYNPYPTMEEGILMTIGIIGAAVSLITLIMTKLIMKIRNK